MLLNGQALAFVITPTGIFDVEKSFKVANLFISVGFETSLIKQLEKGCSVNQNINMIKSVRFYRDF
jgi:hypothetical protein